MQHGWGGQAEEQKAREAGRRGGGEAGTREREQQGSKGLRLGKGKGKGKA